MQEISKLKILIIVLLLASSQIGTDIYLPSFQSMVLGLHTTEHIVQFSITIYYIGFVLCLLALGALSDLFGRKKIILYSLALALLGSLACGLSNSILLFLTGRFLQGCGFGSCAALSRATIRDLCTQPESIAKLSATVGMLYAVVIAIAPVLGGYIEKYFFWQLDFFLIATWLAFFTALVYWELPETPVSPVKGKLTLIYVNYLTVIKDATYARHLFIAFLSTSAITLYLTKSPIILQGFYKIDSVWYGYTWLFNAIILFIGGYVNKLCLKKISLYSLMFIGSSFYLFAGIGGVILNVLHIHILYLFLVNVAVFILGSSLIFPNNSSSAMIRFDKNQSGTASAVYTFAQIIGCVFGSLLALLVHPLNQSIVFYYYFLVGLLTLGSILYTTGSQNKILRP